MAGDRLRAASARRLAQRYTGGRLCGRAKRHGSGYRDGVWCREAFPDQGGLLNMDIGNRASQFVTVVVGLIVIYEFGEKRKWWTMNAGDDWQFYILLGCLAAMVIVSSYLLRSRNRPSITPPAVKHVHTVRFEYLPASPLQNGWIQAYEEGGTAEFGSDPDLIGSLRMRVTKGVVAIHHDLPPHARRANRIEFRARYSTTTMIFTMLTVGTRDGSAQRKVFVKYYYGELMASPTWPNPNPGRNAEAWLPEQTLHWPADVFDDGCLGFRLPLDEVVKVLLGSQGWVFKSIEGIRLRGDLSISPIDLQSTPKP